jgi:hypothetical protein
MSIPDADVPIADQIGVAHLRMVLETLAATVAAAEKAVAGLPAEGVPLADLAGLLVDLDAVAGAVADVREQVERRARDARGWSRNRAAWEALGLRAERGSSPRRIWDVTRTAGRLAPLLRADPETGELDMGHVSGREVEAILRRFLRFASVSGYRTTELNGQAVEYEDLLKIEPRPARVKVFRETGASPGERQ